MLTAKDFFFRKEFLVVSHLILYLELLVSSASISLQLHKLPAVSRSTSSLRFC